MKVIKLLDIYLPGTIGSCLLFASRWLVYWGNIVNAEVLAVTILQILSATKETEAGWNRRKHAMTWSAETCGAAKFDEMRYEYAICMYKYWDSFRIYEMTSIFFFRRANDTFVSAGAVEFAGTSVWAAFYALAQKQADLKDNMHFTRTVHCMYELFKNLRIDHVEFLPKLLMMCLRSLDGFAKSRLCPEGLGHEPVIKRVTQQDIQNLLAPMKASETMKSLEEGLDVQEVIEKEEKQAKQTEEKNLKKTQAAQAKKEAGPKGKKNKKQDAMPTVAGSGQKRAMSACDKVTLAPEVGAKQIVESIDDEDKEKPFLSHLLDFWKYLLAKDANQKDEISKFIDLCLAGTWVPAVPINGKPTKGFKIVRKVIKLDVYRVGKLPIDADMSDVTEFIVPLSDGADERTFPIIERIPDSRI